MPVIKVGVWGPAPFMNLPICKNLPIPLQNAGGATCRRRAASCTDISTYRCPFKPCLFKPCPFKPCPFKPCRGGVGWVGWGGAYLNPPKRAPVHLQSWPTGAKRIQPCDNMLSSRMLSGNIKIDRCCWVIYHRGSLWVIYDRGRLSGNAGKYDLSNAIPFIA